MGGNALQYVKTVRKTAEEYYPLMRDVLDQVSDLFPIARCTVIKNYTEKTDFGDGDILLATDLLPENWMLMVQIHFNPGEFVINRLGGTPLTYTRPDIPQSNPDLANQNVVPNISPPCMCVSFDYQGFQIDIMSVDTNQFNSARDYYAYNDLSNLIGRIANHAGFKFGWQGLYKSVMIGTHAVGDIHITSDYDDMLMLFGYDFIEWKHGFKTREELFKFAASSPYFHRSIFQLENLNHENRARNKKRTTFMAFLEWLEDKPELDKHEWVLAKTHDESPERDAQHEKWLLHVSRYFPNVLNDIKWAVEAHHLHQKSKKIFSGGFVFSLVGYKENKLGQFMHYCELKLPELHVNKTWDQWVTSVGPNQFVGYIQDKAVEFEKLTLDEQASYAKKRPSNIPAPHSHDVKQLYAAATASLRKEGRNHKE